MNGLIFSKIAFDIAFEDEMELRRQVARRQQRLTDSETDPQLHRPRVPRSEMFWLRDILSPIINHPTTPSCECSSPACDSTCLP